MHGSLGSSLLQWRYSFSLEFESARDNGCIAAPSSFKTTHPKAGPCDFRNWQFRPDNMHNAEIQSVPCNLEKQESEEVPENKNAELTENSLDNAAADWLHDDWL